MKPLHILANFAIGVFVVVIFLIGFWTGQAHAQSVAFSSNLYYGITHNDNVKALQEFLTEQGDYTGPISGNFFALTQAGVKKFQGSNSLPVTGYFGVLSRGVANGILAALTPQPPAVELGTPSQGGGQDSVGGVQSTGSSPAQPSAPSGVGVAAAAVPQAPTCTLTAQAVNRTGYGWQVMFGWQYTQGATATISSGGKVIFYPQAGVPNSLMAHQSLYYYLFGSTDYEMDVTLDGLTGSCTAHADIPAPQN